ncbi:MAG: class I SAM-dependent methyltransferase, partial [Pseudomonadota bacterium]
YDLGNPGSVDRDFYLELPGPPPQDILDLGCGTGLLCRALAKQGHRVVGVDPAAAMLSVARRKAHSEAITWTEATSESFQSERRFDLIIMTGHAFQVLLTDNQVTQTLQTMADHLKPDGMVVFETRNPDLDWDSVWAHSYVMQTEQGPVRATRRMTKTNGTPGYLSFAWDYEFSDETVTSESTLRFLNKAQLVAFANIAGLSVSELLGDWDGSQFVPQTSREMIFKLTKKDAELR